VSAGVIGLSAEKWMDPRSGLRFGGSLKGSRKLPHTLFAHGSICSSISGSKAIYYPTDRAPHNISCMIQVDFKRAWIKSFYVSLSNLDLESEHYHSISLKPNNMNVPLCIVCIMSTALELYDFGNIHVRYYTLPSRLTQSSSCALLR
jgi:hypothetical protein